MSYAVGIDLGTTNSVVSVYRRGGIEVLPIDGRPTLPSVVSFRDDGNVLVGRQAKSRMLLAPEDTVASAKRSMGDRAKRYKVGGKLLTPVDISSMVLRRIVEGAREALREDVWDAVITVPAYFNEEQREDTKRAGEEAGLNVLRLVPEPTAAAIAYGLDKGRDQTLMVYDLGGGTFDVSILQVRGNNFEVKAVGGDSHLGGDDFDQAIMEWAAARLRQQTGVDLMADSRPEARAAQQRLKEAAETAKIELSESNESTIIIPELLGHSFEAVLTLDEYNGLIGPLLNRTVECMHSTLRDARLSADDIDRVILVGGSTKTRAVREIVAREIKDPYTSDRVDEVVSHGAAIMAASLFAPEEDLAPIQVTDVTAHSLGIDALDDRQQIMFRPIIARQTPYPCRQGMLGSTNRPNQDEVQMRVFRGEEPQPDRNTYLGELSLPVSPPQSQLVPIGAMFELDADGILHFTAVQFPLTPAIEPIVQYAVANNGNLDVAGTDALIATGAVKTRSVTIQNR